jgi:hypothetical protein
MKKQLILLMTVSALSFTACEDTGVEPGEKFPVPPKTTETVKPIVINSFYPESAKTGAEVAIFGENFGNDIKENYVTINGWESEIVTVSYSGMILIKVPNYLRPGDYAISVHAHGQTGTSEKTFKVLDPNVKP